MIFSFIGEDCSWQFWRFHNISVMEKKCRHLRIGRISGVENRYAEPAQFIGMKSLDDTDF